jgi:hypothetical protein
MKQLEPCSLTLLRSSQIVIDHNYASPLDQVDYGEHQGANLVGYEGPALEGYGRLR